MSRIDTQAVEALLIIGSGLGAAIALITDEGWIFLTSFGMVLAALWIDIDRDRRDRR